MLNDFLITRDVIGFMQHFITVNGLHFPEFEAHLAELRQRQTVSYEQWWSLLEQLRSLHPIPALGLEIGRTVRIEDCGVLGYLFQTSRNLSEALSCFQRFQRLIYAGSLAHIERPSAHVLSVVWNPEQGYSSQDSDALLLTAMLAVSRQITHNQQLKPVCIQFTQAVAIDQQAAYQVYFGCDVLFCCQRLSISLAVSDLLEPIPKSDQFLHQLLGQQAEFLLEKMPQHDVFMAALRDAFLRCLHDGYPQAAAVAAEMQLSVRSLHRELAKRQKVFRDVLKDVRKSMAQSYLADESLSLTDIAMLLGYSEQSAFCRAFSSWFACSPLRWRQRRIGTATAR